jgi:translocator protein
MRKKVNWKVLLASLIIVYIVAFLGSLFTAPNTSTDWYQSIRPSITPPNWVFPIAWNFLFFLITLSLYFSWVSSNKKQKVKIAWVFAINFVLNILWSVLFFGLKNVKLAFVEIIILWISILSMILVTRKINKKASYLLWPYLIWVSFATILNFLSAF